MAIPPDPVQLREGGPKGSATNAELSRKELTRRMRFAVAGTHGVGAEMSGNELMDYVLEHGLLSRVERERMQAERDAREQDTTLSSSPG